MTVIKLSKNHCQGGIRCYNNRVPNMERFQMANLVTPTVHPSFVYYAFRSCANGNEILQRIDDLILDNIYVGR